jgi:hypothetical protein
MKISPGRKSVLFLVLVFLASAASAQIGSMVSNWSVPAYSGSASGAKGVKTEGDVTYPVLFVGFYPCRDVDTRGPAGPYGGPALTAGVPRNFSINTGAPCTGIAAGAVAYSLNITVTNTQGPGFILIYPQGGIQPVVSTVNYVAGQTIANAAIVPAGIGGGITVVAGVSGTDLIIDINGYFAANPINSGEPVTVVGSYGGGLLFGRNNNSSGYGVWGDGFAGGIGVYGTTTAVGGSTKAGVFGMSGDGIGTYGGSTNYNGVWASSTNLDAVAAFGGRDGGYFQGIRNGVAAVSTGTAFASGVYGAIKNDVNDTGGVFGQDSHFLPAYANVIGSAGVRGNGKNGVIGVTSTNVKEIGGVVGIMLNSTGGLTSFGVLGYSPTVAVQAFGSIVTTGAKDFVEPHPTDPGKMIAYVALEGPESGTYFRGTAQIVDGTAIIPVPDHFAMVTDSDGLTVQLTPVGAAASMYVVSEDLDQIVVRSNQDVTFHYQVNGIRHSLKDHRVIADNDVFLPRSADSKMPAVFLEAQKQRLIDNGTYNSDGTVNMVTAERMGWAKVWRERDEQAKASAAKPTTLSPERP